MLLIIAGMRRSGSTLSYQIGCELVGDDKRCLRRVDKLPTGVENRPEWYVVKTHKYLPQMLEGINNGKVKVVTTIRDPRDIVVSTMTLKPDIVDLDMAITSTNSSAIEQVLWEKHARESLFVCRYEKFYDNLDYLICMTCLAMGKQVEQMKIREIAKKFSFERNKAKSERITKTEADFLFPGHLQDGAIGKWKTKLRPAQVYSIQNTVGEEWMEEHEYESWYGMDVEMWI